MPTRFKYTKVDADAFALSPVDILLATDAELNQYVGLKKLAPYRKGAPKWDRTRNERLKELKTSLQERKAVFGADDDASKAAPTKKRKGKKERLRAKAIAEPEGVEDVAVQEPEPSSKKRKAEQDIGTPAHGTDGDSGPSKAKRRRHKKSGKSSVEI